MANGVSPELEKKFGTLNNILGWLVFFIAIFVYYSTVESTASFWDCSENLSVYWKLEIGHSPGEPFLQLVQHCISLLAGGDVHKAAPVMNHAASTFSAFTILFLFWTITYFARKIAEKSGGLTANNMWAVLGSGVIGATSFIFADSLWFSSIEASVWAMACCFAALMFWCVTKWERSTTRPENWMILIFYLIGLAIGVHLLCLLFIPAAVFVYYFKTHPDGINNKWANFLLSPVTKNLKMQGIIVAGIASVIILGGVKNVIIPKVVDFGFYFELFFVNTVGMPFNSGIAVYAISLIGLIAWGIAYSRGATNQAGDLFVLITTAVLLLVDAAYTSIGAGSILLHIIIMESLLAFVAWGLYTLRQRNPAAINTIFLSLAMLLVGYSTYMIVAVRASAPTPLNEGNPSDPISMHAYLGRQQYGDWPLIYGQYYTAPQINPDPGSPVYAKDEKKGKYVISYTTEVPKFDPKFCTFFPRMWEGSENRPQGYKSWGGTDFEKVMPTDGEGGERKPIDKPSFGDNLHYFFHYQIYFMYIRYFMWDFVGRENDIQGLDPPDVLHGNWITGIPFIDGMIGPPQENQPDELAHNKQRAPMYGLPLLLGLIGFFFQYKRDRGGALIVGMFFLFAGLAIVLYLNQYPYQPRERFYSYVISFYSFAIWIGLGVMGVFNFLAKRLAKDGNTAAMGMVATALCVVVPVVMCKAEWPAHDRNGHYLTRDIAVDYLESCAPNAIIFTNGDNDTFPLWYAQEVEGIRTDVRVCNLELLGMSWYVDMMNRQAYESERMPFSLTHDQYKDGTRDVLYFYDRGIKGYTDLGEIIEYIKSDDQRNMLALNNGTYVNYFPTKNFELKVNKANVIKSGALPASLNDSIPAVIDFTMGGGYVTRSTLMVLDAIAHNDWKRPIYFAVSLPSSSYMGLDKYLQLEGMAYRLVPIKSGGLNSAEGPRVSTSIMYNNMMNKFRFGNMSKGVYMDDVFRKTIAGDLRAQGATLAMSLLRENKKDSAVKVLNKVVDSIPYATCPYDYFSYMITTDYYEAGAFDRGNKLAKAIFTDFESNLRYYHMLDREAQNYYARDIEEMSAICGRLQYMAGMYKQNDLAKDLETRMKSLQSSGALIQEQMGGQ